MRLLELGQMGIQSTLTNNGPSAAEAWELLREEWNRNDEYVAGELGQYDVSGFVISAARSGETKRLAAATHLVSAFIGFSLRQGEFKGVTALVTDLSTSLRDLDVDSPICRNLFCVMFEMLTNFGLRPEWSNAAALFSLKCHSGTDSA